MIIEYPIRRGDLRELGPLEEALQLVTDAAMAPGRAISAIGTLLFSAAVRLELDDDVVNLCGFSQRVGYDMLSADFRASYFADNCWTFRPRDTVDLKFTHQTYHAPHRLVAPVDVRNAAMVLYFILPLGWETRWKLAHERLDGFIKTNHLWSYEDTERVARTKKL